MKTRKQKLKNSTKDFLYKLFMALPIPVSITRVEDGTYVEVNEAAQKYMGLPRTKIIGHKASELGHFSQTQRYWLIDAIKKQGFAKDIPLELKVGKQEVLHMLISVLPIKIGKDSFFMSYATDISSRKIKMKKFKNDKFLKMTLPNPEFVNGRMQQYRLSPRQREIAVLSSTGHSDREIAGKLNISEYTVKDHMKEIRKIIGVRRRSEIFPTLLNLR
ncbi:MAG: PAS and helix-turn-helix domain-containing protein [Syntrophaceae bacterium]|nr:PAS and helix-turn-helix domain-containing protein [Syntrophaceae bacterium]